MRARDSNCWLEIRAALLDFIADFANWDASAVPAFLEAARALTQAATDALTGRAGTRPMVFDSFAGGAAIPLEALRIGADACASDVNPVAILLNKVVLEYVPVHGHALAEQVAKWGAWIRQEAQQDLARFYPKRGDGSTPVAYLWARTVRCEGPGCGVMVPLLRSPWLANKERKVAIRLVPGRGEIAVEIVERPKVADVTPPTIRRGSATCPACGYTTPVARVRAQLRERHGGGADAKLLCVVTSRAGQDRAYALPSAQDLEAVSAAQEEVQRRGAANRVPLSLIPDEVISQNELRRISVPIYGMQSWGDIFTPRQSLALSTFAGLVREARERIMAEVHDRAFADAICTCLGLLVDKQADRGSSLCRWDLSSAGGRVASTFGRQALGFVSDFVEPPPFGDASGDFGIAVDGFCRVLNALADAKMHAGQVLEASAQTHPLPNDAADAFITDPPYYDSVPYAYLSDYFYVWLRRSLFDIHPDLLRLPQVPKESEIVVDRPHELSTSKKDIAFYERELGKAFAEGRRVLRPNGIAVIVFASKTTASWEAILQAVVDAGWIVTGSWPIDTEMETRVAAQGQARLASSVHLVCRSRGKPGGSLRDDDVGAWREVLSELPSRIHDWMPRLAEEGVVGADAIFACLGPALEIFSRHSRVEKASGETVTLRDYLEQVWAAVAREALSLVFKDADASGLEEDARLTAIWLWTLSAGPQDPGAVERKGEEGTDCTSDDEEESRPHVGVGFVLEFDAARKIAQGLGAHLEKLGDVIEVKGDKARLLAVAERAKVLFRRDASSEGETSKGKGKPSKNQLDLFAEIEAAEKEGLLGNSGVPKVGATTLDRVHQAMILFGAGRSEALKRFVVEEGSGKDARFWKLAQSLSALYPPSTHEKRWVDGVLARKKSLGF
jgi:adenine-specific DNA methylase